MSQLTWKTWNPVVPMCFIQNTWWCRAEQQLRLSDLVKAKFYSVLGFLLCFVLFCSFFSMNFPMAIGRGRSEHTTGGWGAGAYGPRNDARPNQSRRNRVRNRRRSAPKWMWNKTEKPCSDSGHVLRRETICTAAGRQKEPPLPVSAYQRISFPSIYKPPRKRPTLEKKTYASLTFSKLPQTRSTIFCYWFQVVLFFSCVVSVHQRPFFTISTILLDESVFIFPLFFIWVTGFTFAMVTLCWPFFFNFLISTLESVACSLDEP